jgi:cytochrome c oxidase subunit 3
MTSVLQINPDAVAWDLPPRGRVGVVGLILAEGSLLGVFVVAYLFYRGNSLCGPYPQDVLEVPVFNILCLLASSVTIRLAVRVLRRRNQRQMSAWLSLTSGRCA